MCIFIYSSSAWLVSFEIKLISKEVGRAKLEYMNIHPPPAISVLATALITPQSTDRNTKLRPLFHYTGLHRSEAIFIPDWGVVYITLTVIRAVGDTNSNICRAGISQVQTAKPTVAFEMAMFILKIFTNLIS